MQCNSNETMCNLMRQVKLLVKKRYKMNGGLNDFEYNLIKNSKKLPINGKELIGDFIKKKDIIFLTVNHLLSDDEEEEKKEEEAENKPNEKQEKVLCPKDKLPILKRPGYYMNPNEYDISRMSVDEIKNVKDFEIYNENGGNIINISKKL